MTTQNIIHGTGSNDMLTGTSAVDVFIGTAGSDTLDGGDAGYNQVNYDGSPADYVFTRQPDGSVCVKKPGGGVDTLKNIGGFWFNGAAVWISMDEALASHGGGTTPAPSGTINGTAGNDYLSGTAGNDVINGLGGQDTIKGSAGSDTINGGDAGYNQVDYAGAPSDYHMERNNDGTITVTKPGGGVDTLTNISGFWFEGAGVWLSLDDALKTCGCDGNGNGGGTGGGTGNGTINGTAGNDYLSGTAGNDVINGLGGQDTIKGSAGSDTINGGDAGYNQVDYAGSVKDYVITKNGDGSYTVKKPGGGTDTLTNIGGFWFEGEAKWYGIDDAVAACGGGGTGGGTGTGTINGTAGNDYLTGTSGNDVINGLGGQDTIKGSAGSDKIDGGDAGYNQVDYAGSVKDYVITKNGDGTYTVKKPGGGTDTLTNIGGFWFEGEAKWYSIDDAVAACGNGNGGGTPPANTTTANDDSVDTAVGTPVTIDVLANDTDAQGDAQSIQSFSNGANGTVTLVNGKLVYTPAAGFVGVDTFTYTVVDSKGATDTATVEVCIEADPQPENTASIGDRVWLDANKNGVQDNGEAGVSGVTVQLKDANGNVIATTQTNANGEYLFDKLAAGNYQVGVTAPSQYEFTAKDAFGNGADGIDSDVNVSTGHTDTIALADGQAIRTVDAGLVVKAPPATASLGDLVFEDANFNGIQDAGEKGLANVKVNLTDANGTVLKTMNTDANGNYKFTDLAAGDYKVKVEGPNGYFVTKSNIGDDAKDSDIGSDGSTGIIRLNEGQHDLTIDAGLYRKASVGDHVWGDGPQFRADGIQQDNGIGTEYVDKSVIPVGVTIRLYREDGTLVATTKSDSKGDYKFGDLDPGKYYIDFDSSTSPFSSWGGLKWSPANQGTDDTKDSDAIAYGPLVDYGYGYGVFGTYRAKTEVFELTSGQHDGTRDAGIQISPIMLDLNKDGKIGVTGETTSIDKSGITSIGKTVSFDLDADGVKDQIEWSDGKGDGFLVDMTKIGANGEIDGSALFGDEGGKFANGYEKLALHDLDGDGMIMGAELEGFGVWIDNGDAILQDGELKSAAELNITSISADMQIAYDDAGRALMQATAEVNGETVLTEDVWFAQEFVQPDFHHQAV